jgi:hypothetical protein
MQRHRALTLVSLLPLVLAAGCGESPPEDPCGSGRPRWVPLTVPDDIDMEFRVSQYTPGRPSYSVAFDDMRFLFWGGYRLRDGALVPSIQGAQYYPRDKEWRPWPELDDPNAPAIAEHWGFGGEFGYAVRGGIRFDGGEIQWDLSRQGYASSSISGFARHLWAVPEPLVDEAMRSLRATVVTGPVLGVTDSDPPEPFAFYERQPIALPPHGVSPHRFDRSDRTLVFGAGGPPEDPVVTGGLFDQGAWEPLPEPGRPTPRSGHSVVLGTVWGGQEWGRGGALKNDGARENGDRWTPMTPAGAPSPRRDHAAADVGQVFIFGGWDGERWLNDGALYDILEDRWTPLPSACAPPPMKNPVAVPVPRRLRYRREWGDTAVLVWGTSTEDDAKGVGGLLLLPGVCCLESAEGLKARVLPPGTACTGLEAVEVPMDECAERLQR